MPKVEGLEIEFFAHPTVHHPEVAGYTAYKVYGVFGDDGREATMSILLENKSTEAGTNDMLEKMLIAFELMIHTRVANYLAKLKGLN